MTGEEQPGAEEQPEAKPPKEEGSKAFGVILMTAGAALVIVAVTGAASSLGGFEVAAITGGWTRGGALALGLSLLFLGVTMTPGVRESLTGTWGAVGLIGVAAIILFTAASIAFDNDSGEKAATGTTTATSTETQAVAVPQVIGLAETVARDRLGIDGFEVETRSVERPVGSADVGQVVAQDPAAGSIIESGSIVTIEVGVSNGATVPDVVGRPQADAEGRLIAEGFEVDVVMVGRPVGSSNIGNVLTQDPIGGALADPGAIVTIEVGVSTGVKMPNVVGLSQSEAERILRESGLAPQIESADVSPGSSEIGFVVEQSPQAEGEIERNSLVTIHVGESSGLASTGWQVRTIVDNGDVLQVSPGDVGMTFLVAGEPESFQAYDLSFDCGVFLGRYLESDHSLSIGNVFQSSACGPDPGEPLRIFINVLQRIESLRARADGGLDFLGDGLTVTVDPL